jgi:glycosyltransferase involved in cell wall biosynthesis
MATTQFDASPSTAGSPGRYKVCLASRAPFVGGAEVALERLALGLTEFGHDVFLLLGLGGAVEERFERAGLRCLVTRMALSDKWRVWRSARSALGVRRILRRERPAVVHSNDLPTHQMVSGVARALRLPRICHHRFPFDGPSIDWFNKHGAERHLFVSRALMEELCASSAWLNAASRAVVYDGLPLPAAPTDTERGLARQRLGLSAGRTIVTFAGQIIERKGVADLLRAWAILDPSQRDHAELLVVGDDLAGKGQYRTEMESLAASLGVAARFVGFQKHVAEWLLASDVAVVPSHVEPLGNATLEAMAHGLPVLGCAVGGIPEMVEVERTGLLVPPRSPEALAAALTRLLADPQMRRQLGSAGRQRCQERFSLVAHVRAVQDEYLRLLSPALVGQA